MKLGDEISRNIGLLVLRVVAGGMMMTHGYEKLSQLFHGDASSFPNPIGVGSVISIILATGAEFFCALLVVLGLFTRFTAVPVIITMFVAIFIVHEGASLATRELAILYLAAFTTILLAGPGKYCVDSKIFSKK